MYKFLCSPPILTGDLQRDGVAAGGTFGVVCRASVVSSLLPRRLLHYYAHVAHHHAAGAAGPGTQRHILVGRGTCVDANGEDACTPTKKLLTDKHMGKRTSQLIERFL